MEHVEANMLGYDVTGVDGISTLATAPVSSNVQQRLSGRYCSTDIYAGWQ